MVKRMFKNVLGGIRHENDDDELELAVLKWGKDAEQMFFKVGIHKPVSLGEICFDRDDDYVEN